MTLDLTPSNRAIYAGCEVVKIAKNRYNLTTPLPAAVLIVAKNIQEIVSALSDEARGEKLVLTGSAPNDIYLTAQSIAGPFFKRVVRVNGNTGLEIEIPQPPQPPSDFQIESED